MFVLDFVHQCIRHGDPDAVPVFQALLASMDEDEDSKGELPPESEVNSLINK
jgi:hypothetical protein